MLREVFMAPGSEVTTKKTKPDGSSTETVHGKLSAMRILFSTYGGGVLAVWAYVSVVGKDVKDIPTTVAVILGELFGSKALQSLGEKNS